jgi:hypothetical protein
MVGGIVTPEQLTVFATVLSQLGLGGIFVIAWFRSEKLRDSERVLHNERLDKLQQEYHAAQDAHRAEIVALLTDATYHPRDEKVNPT